MNRFIVSVSPTGVCTLASSPADPAEGRRCVRRAGARQAALDGRFDNLAELAGAFAAAGRPLGEPDDDLGALLRAYELWGDACAGYLRGDFAFAIWDAPRGALICARDILGNRPLYVHARNGAVAVASEIAPLLRLPSVSREPNEALLAECLNGVIVHRTETVWRDIERLLPAHVLVAERGRVTVHEYWRPDRSREIRYADDREYADHLADLLRASIRVRLRGARSVGVMLSGGLDSSSIVAAMHEMQIAAADRPLATFSMSSPGEPWDEVEYLDAVTARFPVASARAGHAEPPASYYVERTKTYQDLAPFPNGVMADAMLTAAAGAGVDVLLTGLWSDEWLAGSFLHYADLVAGGRLRDAWRHYRAQSHRRRRVSPELPVSHRRLAAGAVCRAPLDQARAGPRRRRAVDRRAVRGAHAPRRPRPPAGAAGGARHARENRIVGQRRQRTVDSRD